MENSILHSEKIKKKSCYKNKFQLFQEQQQKSLFMNTISQPNQVPYSGKQLLMASNNQVAAIDLANGYGSLNDSIEGSFEGMSNKDQSTSAFGPNQNAYAINLGKKAVNKRVKNLNEQTGLGKIKHKNFKEDLVLF